LLSAGDVGGTAEPGTTVIGLNAPPPRGDARKIEDDGTAAEQIVEFLAEKRLV
jgi:electron transfer flavoprotein beta subunit